MAAVVVVALSTRGSRASRFELALGGGNIQVVIWLARHVQIVPAGAVMTEVNVVESRSTTSRMTVTAMRIQFMVFQVR
jgi:hypothetical protein